MDAGDLRYQLAPRRHFGRMLQGGGARPVGHHLSMRISRAQPALESTSPCRPTDAAGLVTTAVCAATGHRGTAPVPAE